MTIETLKNLLQHYGLSPNKTYGQNFLMDEIVLEDMIDTAGITTSDVVLEVGPGIGNLTERLLGRAKQVLAIEKDPQFLPVLRTLAQTHKNFHYELADILQFNLAGQGMLSGDYKVVANIPYYITGKIVQLLLHLPNKPQSITLLMQKEVAENITAEVGKMNLLAISVQLFADAKITELVPARKFYPAPKVDSAVIHIQLHHQPKYLLHDQKKLFRVLRAAFAGKRKQLHNTLTNNLKLEKKLVEQILTECRIDPAARPQQLSIPQWLALVEKIQL